MSEHLITATALGAQASLCVDRSPHRSASDDPADRSHTSGRAYTHAYTGTVEDLTLAEGGSQIMHVRTPDHGDCVRGTSIPLCGPQSTPQCLQ